MSAIVLGRVLQQRGVAKKPMFVVPAKTIKKWIRETKTLFPNAKIVDLGNLPKDKREKMLFDIAASTRITSSSHTRGLSKSNYRLT